jgi:predicted MFS family arabinose efflux permease
LEWSKEEKELKITLISFTCIFGMALGCLMAGKLFRFGKRKVVMIFQIVCLVGSFLSFVSLDFETILVGRFIFGMSAGVFVSMCPAIIEGTVPGYLMD